MNGKPLTYDSLKAIILYMEPHTRILLSSRIPSIRVAERTVPLKIEQLIIGQHSVRINDTIYECAIYRVDCKDKLPYKVSGYSRLNGRWNCDVDEFGIRDYITKAGLPGNNGLEERNLFGDYDLEVIPTNEGRLEKLRNRLEIEKQRLNQLIDYQSKGNVKNGKYYLFDITCIRHNVPRLYNKEELEHLNNEEMVEEAIEETNRKIKKMENELDLLDNKKEGICSEFEIHLSEHHLYKKGSVIERIKYTGDIHKAEESLMKFMFERRTIQINKLKILPTCSIRMPCDLNMRIKHLDLNRSALEIVKSIMDKFCFPIEKLTIFLYYGEAENLDFAFISCFKTLVIRMMDNELDFQFVQNLQNQIVYFETFPEHFLGSDHSIFLIRSWVEGNKPLGSCFSFLLYRFRPNPIKILRAIRDRIDGAVDGNKCLNIPMKNPTTVLTISYELIGQLHVKDCLIKMTVMPAE